MSLTPKQIAAMIAAMKAFGDEDEFKTRMAAMAFTGGVIAMLFPKGEQSDDPGWIVRRGTPLTVEEQLDVVRLLLFVCGLVTMKEDENGVGVFTEAAEAALGNYIGMMRAFEKLDMKSNLFSNADEKTLRAVANLPTADHVTRDVEVNDE